MFEREFKSSLREIVQKVREETRQWYYTDVARASGLSDTTCSRFIRSETKSPQYRTVVKIAKAIGVDIAFEKKKVTQPKLRLVGRKAAKRKIRLKKVG